MGQQNEKVAHVTLGKTIVNFRDAKIYRTAKRLGDVADFLRCDLVDAAMHNRMHKSDSNLESITVSNGCMFEST